MTISLLVGASAASAATMVLDFTAADFTNLSQIDSNGTLSIGFPPVNGAGYALVEYDGLSGLGGGLSNEPSHGLEFGTFYSDDPNDFRNYNDAFYPGQFCDLNTCFASDGPHRRSATLYGPVTHTVAECLALGLSPCNIDFNPLILDYDFTATAVEPYAHLRLTLSDQPIAPTDAVPEPAVWALSLVGFFGIGGVLRRQGQHRHRAQAAACLAYQPRQVSASARQS